MASPQSRARRWSIAWCSRRPRWAPIGSNWRGSKSPCHLVFKNDEIVIEQLAINSELGNFALTGSVKTSDLVAERPYLALVHENYTIKGQLELAPLARMLERTLGVRQGTDITGGQIVLSVSGQQRPEGMSWSGQVDASHLAAEANGRQIIWENPLSIQFSSHESADGLPCWTKRNASPII